MRYSTPGYFSQSGLANAKRPAPKAMVDPKRMRQRMVREQIEARGITDEGILNAMSTVPRHLFVPDACNAHSYDDAPLPIGYGQTISQPYMVACMTMHLKAEKGMRVLEIGAGSGYQAAILAAIGCNVIAIERLPGLYARAKACLRALGLRSIYLRQGDGTMGFPAAAPFERILVSAGGPHVPAPLLDQLAENGILLIPVGDRPKNQRLLRLRKTRGSVACEDLGNVAFVNLVGAHGWGAE